MLSDITVIDFYRVIYSGCSPGTWALAKGKGDGGESRNHRREKNGTPSARRGNGTSGVPIWGIAEAHGYLEKHRKANDRTGTHGLGNLLLSPPMGADKKKCLIGAPPTLHPLCPWRRCSSPISPKRESRNKRKEEEEEKKAVLASAQHQMLCTTDGGPSGSMSHLFHRPVIQYPPPPLLGHFVYFLSLWAILSVARQWLGTHSLVVATIPVYSRKKERHQKGIME
jgi:hypothetical protein